MLDNWGLSDCAWWRLERETGKKEDITARRMRHQYFHESPMRKKDHVICWQHMLTSLVLWDHIYLNFADSGPSRNYFEMNSFINVMEQLVGETDIFKVLSPVAEHIRHGMGADLRKYKSLYDNLLREQGHNSNSELLSRGIIYLLSANVLGYDYMPHPRRAAFLQQAGVFSTGFDRTKYLDILDEEVKKYVDKMNALMDHQLKTVSFPLLYDFITAHASSSKEEVMVALELRENKNVKFFRESLNKIQRDYELGNLLSLSASLKETQEICNAITGEMYTRPLSFSVSLGLSPSIDINFDFSKKVHSKLHTTFLYDLASYAIKGRSKNKYNL